MIKKLLSTPDTFATPIVLYLFERNGMDIFNWEPETVSDYLVSIEPQVSPRLIERVNAALGLFTSDLFWQDPVVFAAVCRSLSRRRFTVSREPSLLDITWGVTESGMLTRDPESGMPMSEFSESVKAYVMYLFKTQAVYSMPDSFKDYFQDIPFNLAIDDPEIAMARQQESDDDAMDLETQAAGMMTTMLKQIKASGVKLIDSAANDIDSLLSA